MIRTVVLGPLIPHWVPPEPHVLPHPPVIEHPCCDVRVPNGPVQVTYPGNPSHPGTSDGGAHTTILVVVALVLVVGAVLWAKHRYF